MSLALALGAVAAVVLILATLILIARGVDRLQRARRAPCATVPDLIPLHLRSGNPPLWWCDPCRLYSRQRCFLHGRNPQDIPVNDALSLADLDADELDTPLYREWVAAGYDRRQEA